jgi:hypothetical protein
MVLSQLLLLLGTAASFLTSPSDAVDASSGKRHFNNIQPLSSDIIDTQVALVRAQLPPDIVFSISCHETQPPSSDVSSFTRISTEVERVVGCILPPPLPPNTDDCGFLIHSMGRVSSYTPPSRDGCFQYKYRSCFLFNCAGPCQVEGFQYGEWYSGLVQIMSSCVVGMGRVVFLKVKGSMERPRGKQPGSYILVCWIWIIRLPQYSICA